MKYYEKVGGDLLFLSPVCQEDAPIYTRWMNDPQVTDGLGNTSFVFSLEKEQKFLQENMDGYTFAIVRRQDGKLLGNCSIQEVDFMHQRAEVGIFIGDEEDRGKGYGTAALGLLIGYAFDTLHLHSLMLRVFDYNERAIRCYEKLGFRRIGCRREAHWHAGQWHGIVLMDLVQGPKGQ